MKNFALTILAALFLLVPTHLQSASAQGVLERNILGVVVEQQEQEKTKERTLVVEIKLDTTVDGVELELDKEIANAAALVELAGWKAVKGKNGITWTSDRPVNVVRLRIDVPSGVADKLDKALKDGLKLRFKLGEEAIGTQTFNVKKTNPPEIITEPDKVGLPPRLYPGFNSFSPPEGYTNSDNGTWRAKLKTDKGAEDIPVSPVLTDEEFRRGVDYRFPTKDPLDIKDLTFPGRASRPKDPFHDPIPPLGFLVPPDLPPGTPLEITFVNRFGQTVVGAKVTTDSFQDLGLPPFLITCTPKIFAGDYLCVCGFFPTQFSRNQLLLDGKPLGKLAGTRDTIVFSPKGLRPGRHVIEWNVAAFSDPTLVNPDLGDRQPPSNLDEVAFVLLEVQGTIDQNALFTGQGTTLRLRIIGSEERLPIELTNKTPQIIDMEGGVTQVIQSSGGANNTVERRVKGTMRGNFNIVYKLALPPCPCNPGSTAEITALAGKVDDAPQPPPNTQTANTQTTTPSQNCELIFQECAKAEAEVYQLESEFEKATSGCSKGRGAFDTKFYSECLKRTLERYGAKIKEAYLKELLCYQRYQACVKSQPVAPAPTAASTPSEEQQPAKGEDCNKIRLECKTLEAKRDGLIQSRKIQLARCRVNNKLNQQALEECQKAVFDYYQAQINEVDKKSSDCLKRYEACRAKQGGQ